MITARLLCPWRILSGGGVFTIGGLCALLLYFGVALAPGMHELFVHDVLRHLPYESRTTLSDGWRFSERVSSVHRVVETGQAQVPRSHELMNTELVTMSLVVALQLWAGIRSRRTFAAARDRSIVTFKRYAPLVCGAVAALACMAITYYERAQPGHAPPRPFMATFLLLVYLLPLPLSAAWVVNYQATLPKQAKLRPLQTLDGVPRWSAWLFGLGSMLFGLLSYGVNNVAAFSADLGALLALACLLVLPIGLGYLQGRDRPLHYKLGYAALGGLFGVLELMLPLLLAIYGGSWQLLSCLAWAIALSGLAYRAYVRWSSGWVLLACWLIAAIGCIALTLLAAQLQPVAGESFVLAFVAGGAFACVWFGFYLAVALAFGAHNNEAGGAARSDFYRHFVRVKLQPNRITGYVIGFDRPSASPRSLNGRLRLVDVFELKTGTGGP